MRVGASAALDLISEKDRATNAAITTRALELIASPTERTAWATLGVDALPRRISSR